MQYVGGEWQALEQEYHFEHITLDPLVGDWEAFVQDDLPGDLPGDLSRKLPGDMPGDMPIINIGGISSEAASGLPLFTTGRHTAGITINAESSPMSQNIFAPSAFGKQIWSH
ncbi:hypothetical protein PR002_g665 [Phytophthora rubi]|uniref:Uncharacterized protein n=1 Tax=Phytophthora rubi TaxID=129364 RepID=A0A6A3P3B0_9STRA|nr:hypothetical protein PR002_g665 [Phytophthora rubi]